MMLAEPDAAWIVTDGAAGNLRQARALAEALQVEVREFVVRLRAPWTWCAPRMLPGVALALPRFVPPWPELVIGCGRSAALATRWLRTRAGEASYCVQILDPRIDTRHWDAVVAPAHDGLAGANVLTTLGSLNAIDEDWLADGRAVFPQLGDLPRPRVAVLVGGPRRGIAFDAAMLNGLVERVRACVGAGSVLATTSRRTPRAFADRLRGALSVWPGVFNGGEGVNPYAGMLGWADAIIATPDSVNMLSEACAVGVPVHTVASAALPGKLARFHADLRARGLLTDPGARHVAVAPLRESATIADALWQRIDARA